MTDSVPAAAVANEFLQLQDKNPGSSHIDPMKLQKLIYYAHSWSLAVYDEPLIEEDVEAWSWGGGGAVVRSVYLEFKDFGGKPIVARKAHAVEIEVNPTKTTKIGFSEPELSDETQKALVSKVWDVLKDYTGIQLANSTHNCGRALENYPRELKS